MIIFLRLCKYILITLLIISNATLIGCKKDKEKTIHEQIEEIKSNITKINKQKALEEKNKKASIALKNKKLNQKKVNAKPQSKEQIIQNNRNPFIIGPDSTTSENDRGLLSEYFSGKLELIGIMTEGLKKWAIIRNANGRLFVVTQGSKIGGHEAKVTEITKDGVNIIISDSNETKQYSLKLQEPKE